MCTWFDKLLKLIGMLAIAGALLIGAYKLYFVKHYSILKKETVQQLGL